VATSYIGVKVADGTYYPIFESSYRGKKKLVLTTVRDDQESVQIDLYRGEGPSMENPEYVGSLVVEHIQRAGKGEAEIEMVLGADQNGNLNATASDKATGEYQSLSVSLEALEEEETYDMPDFELDDTQFAEDHDRAIGAEFDEEMTPETESEGETESFDLDTDLGDFEGINLEEEQSEISELAEPSESSSVSGEQAEAPDYFAEEAEAGDAFESEVPDLESEIGEEPGTAEETEGAAAPASAASGELLTSEEQPFEDGRIPEKYRPETRVNPFLLGAFLILALAACGILGYLVFRALQAPDVPALQAGIRHAEVPLQAGLALLCGNRSLRGGRRRGTGILGRHTPHH
jgi:hypothetical protein